MVAAMVVVKLVAAIVSGVLTWLYMDLRAAREDRRHWLAAQIFVMYVVGLIGAVVYAQAVLYVIGICASPGAVVLGAVVWETMESRGANHERNDD